MKLLPLAIAVSTAILSSNVAADELQPLNFNGYMRAGVGLGSESGDNPKYEVFKVGRLGNENDFYGEIGLEKELYNNDGVSFKVDSMLNFFQGQDGEGSLSTNITQFNIQAQGLFADEDAVLWAGQRFYQRHDIHISDFYYWNTSGLGGGIEHVNMGPGKLSVALLEDEASQAGDAQDVSSFNADIRYADISLWSDADLELGVNYNFANEKTDQTAIADDGVMLTAQLTQGFSGGFNKTILQYGTASYGVQMSRYGAGGGYDRTDDSFNDADGWRIINHGVTSLGDNIEFGHQILYGMASDITGQIDDDETFTVVIRPMYMWNDHMRTYLELGGYSETIGDIDGGGGKATIAQAWSAGRGFWARPEIRIYTSYLTDSEDDNAFGTGADSEYTVGMQAEAWW